MSADPYDYATRHIGAETHAAITAFWQHFARNTETLTNWFSSQEGGTQTVTNIMQPLAMVSPDLTWDFGPAEHGHMLTITAEFQDALRPLARLVQHMSPALPNWVFTDTRPPSDPQQLARDHPARFGFPLLLSKIEASLGRNGRIDLHGYGAGPRVFDEVLNVSTLLLGEEKERDWVGYVQETHTETAPPFAPKTWLADCGAAIAKAQSLMPDVPYARLDPSKASGALYGAFNLVEGDPRQDLITFYAPSEAYLDAAIYGPRFSLRGFSHFGEWFMFLKIQSSAAPFGHVEERHEVEDRLHAALSNAGIGGWVAAEHGEAHVYIDFATTDVGRAVDLLRAGFAEDVYAPNANLHFLDQGLKTLALPLSSPT